MRQLLVIVILLLLGNLKAWAQDHYDPKKALSGEELFLKQSNTSRIIATPGQKYLVLDASPVIGGFHRYRFFPGDNIKFRMENETIRFNETIASVSDSSFSIAIINEAVNRMDYQEILLKDVRLMKVSRRIPFISQLAPILPLAGLIYIGADFFNRGVDNKRFTTDSSSLIVGGALMAAGFVCYKLTFSSLKINGRNKLKVLETY
ncbi:hypothetical protein [Dyadobacter bucti]|uniref:hypothetical protein n=1 Tax=Dyadobacter bucti TaxID=2572203 RepID=UPI001107CAB1|nr:hypothetical protein [Dyadobacter bucti]